MQVLYKKQIIIILSFCLLFLFNGCGTASQTEENDVSDFEFTNISDIKYSSKSEKPQIHSKEQLEALREKQKQQIAQIEEQLTLLKEDDKQQIEEEEEENFEEPVYNYESEYVEDYNYIDTDYNYSADYDVSTYNDIYYAEYNEMYNKDGPTPTMPGWYNGYLETSYNASAHYLANTWTIDDEGFYKDENDRYVIGVEISEINPDTGELYQYGDVVQTGKGEAAVYDRGQGAHVHDFAVVW